MAIQSSLAQKVGEKKKPQFDCASPQSSLTQKPMTKLTRTGSLRPVKIFRTNSKNKNKKKSNFKPKKSKFDNFSQTSEESHLKRPTFSSILKDSKFPDQLKHQSRASETEEILPIVKICPYNHCSLHGHHHHDELPQKRFPYLKKRPTNDQKIVKSESQIKKREKVKGRKMSSKDVDFSIEFYAKTRSEPVSSHDHGDAEFANILFGITNNREFSDVTDENDQDSNGSQSVVEKNQSLEKTSHISMWRMIQRHMVSGLAAESGELTLQQVDEESKSEATEFDDDDDANQETEIRKMFAIKLVRDAIEKILLPEVQDEHSTTSEVISEQDSSECSETKSHQSDKSPAPAAKEKSGAKPENGAPNRWSYLKKVIILKKFVKELEKVKKFDPKKPQHLPLPSEQKTAQTATKTVSLRQQTAGEKKNTDEWMLDYALQKVVSELAPTQKRKVALLVQAFETVAPAQDDSPEPRSNVEIQRVGSESKGELEEISESKSGLEKEQHIKMWHMIYQHVVTDIATKIGSDLLLDGEESTTREEKNLQEVEDQTDRSYRLRFTQSDAVKLVRESIDEILVPDDTQSIANDNDSAITKLQQQKSKNWGKLKDLMMLKRSIKALEGFRKLKPQTPQRVDLRREMMNERKKAEQWMLDYAVQHIVTKLTPARKQRVSMLVEAFEAVVPFPEI